jgi:hypothetical protein
MLDFLYQITLSKIQAFKISKYNVILFYFSLFRILINKYNKQTNLLLSLLVTIEFTSLYLLIL